MKLREKIKRFWTLDVHGHEGFTLVELIIVIAILAILSSVAVVGYSSYVTKANMQADRTLAAEIMNAVILYNYAENFAYGSNGTIGYVILTEDGAEAATTLNGDTTNYIADAIKAAYGDNWATTLKLKYNGWTDTANMLNLVATNKYADSVNDSSYINGVGTDILLGDVQSCASSLAEFLVGIGWSGEESAKALNALLGGSADEVPEVLQGYEGELTSEVLANATVFGLANALSDDATSAEVISNFTTGVYLLQNWSRGEDFDVSFNPLYNVSDGSSMLTEAAHTYAALEAFVGYMNLASTDAMLDDLDVKIAEASSTGKQTTILRHISNACESILNEAAAKDMNKALAYFNNGVAKTDGEAYIGIMQTVNQLDGDYVGSLNTSDLFGSSEMADRVNSYVAAVSLSSLLGDSVVGHDLLNDIAGGDYDSAIVLIFTVDLNGNMNCIPCPGDANP